MQKNNSNSRVLYLGSNGFPFGSAVVQRQIQISKIFLEIGFQVTVVNRRSPHSKKISQREKIKTAGNFHGIEYIYCSLIPHRSPSFLIRNIAKLFGIISEFIVIFYYVLLKKVNFFYVNSSNLNQLRYYSQLSKILKVELIYDYVEYMDSLSDRSMTKIVHISSSFDRNFYKYTDKIVYISNFLKEHLERLKYKKEMIKIPPIIDFSFFDEIQPKRNIKYSYFLFCGYAAYYDLIEFVIKAFSFSKAHTFKYKLKLVINGSSGQILRIKKMIEHLENKESIIILSQIPYIDLIKYYKSSVALLIPISSNLQDKARFPFKICEYTAARRPIITSNAGVITEYFKDGENAFIAKPDIVNSFAKKMNLIIENPDNANKVGLKGYELGKKVFNYMSYTTEFESFLKSKVDVRDNR